jgi:hypothetical protein
LIIRELYLITEFCSPFPFLKYIVERLKFKKKDRKTLD